MTPGVPWHYSACHVQADPLLDLAGPLRPAYEAVDWAATPLGPMADWHPALRHATAMALDSEFPITLLWGPERVMVYNAGYVEQIIDKHPAALGRRVQDVFPEAWDAIEPLVQQVFDDDPPGLLEDQFFPLDRNGFLEETYFTFAYSALRDADHTVLGVIDISSETTTQVLARRRLELLGLLGDRLAGVRGTAEVLGVTTEVLAEGVADMPVAEVWLPGLSQRTSGGVLPEAPLDELPAGELLLTETPTGRVAWVPLGPYDEEAGAQPLLVVRLNDMLAPDDPYLGFLRLLGSTIRQALERARVSDAERRISETLQRSLLPQPPEVPGLVIAARYLAAAEQAQIGGDWYDAFVLADGTTVAVIGDIAGHDQDAAAEMAQVRSLLRGVVLTAGSSPASALEQLDTVVQGLDLGTVATLVVTTISAPATDGHRTVRWSNAGHPPPVLIGAGGGARLLEATPDVLLGLIRAPRHEHETDLAPGETLLLYTDGLVERRGISITDSLGWLRDVLDRSPARAAEPLCEHLVAGLSPALDDDIALLAITAGGVAA